MSSESKKILLICYSFPPFPGIGGRRWAKFAKYLTKDNYEFFVIGALNQSLNTSNWNNDVKNNSRIHYYPVKTRFYNFFHNHRFNLQGKISFKLSQFWLRSKYKGNFYDKMLASNDLFYTKAKDLIKKNKITNLIITIAPNRLVEIGIRLKKEFPDLNFIIDVRDPWNICLDDWDHKYLNGERKKYEKNVELGAVAVADKVFSVYQVVIDFYGENHPAMKDNFILLPNGFDKDEIIVKKSDSVKTRIKHVVYTGILYDTSIVLFEEFIKNFREIIKEDSDSYKGVAFDFYSNDIKLFQEIVEKYGITSVKFHKPVSLKEIQMVISDAKATMLFLPPNFEFSLSTKFYEYVSHNKKILLFTNPGEVARIVKESNLGYVMLPGKMKENLKLALSDIVNDNLSSAHSFDIESYAVDNLAEKVKLYLK